MPSESIRTYGGRGGHQESPALSDAVTCVYTSYSVIDIAGVLWGMAKLGTGRNIPARVPVTFLGEHMKSRERSGVDRVQALILLWIMVHMPLRQFPSSHVPRLRRIGALSTKRPLIAAVVCGTRTCGFALPYLGMGLNGIADPVIPLASTLI